MFRFLIFSQVIIECQKHDDYQESLRWLLDHLEEYAEHGKAALKEEKDSKERVTRVRWGFDLLHAKLIFPTHRTLLLNKP